MEQSNLVITHTILLEEVIVTSIFIFLKFSHHYLSITFQFRFKALRKRIGCFAQLAQMFINKCLVILFVQSEELFLFLVC